MVIQLGIEFDLNYALMGFLVSMAIECCADATCMEISHYNIKHP